MKNLKNPPKILLIEDDRSISEMYRIAFLDIHHMPFSIARGGKEGLEKIKTEHPDIVLLDIMMPDMDGYMVLHEIHKQKIYDLLIIMLSNLNQKVDIEKAQKLNVYNYLIKSDYTPEELVANVERIFSEASK